jgi:hypothetical protein
MRVGLVTSLTAVNSVYRGMPLLELARRGHEVHFGLDSRTRLREDALRACDVVHVHRFHDEPTRKLMLQLRAAGVGVVWDNDDDLTRTPEGTAARETAGPLRSQQLRSDMTRMLELAHVVTTPSAELAHQYRAWGAEHVEVVENFLPASYATGPSRPRDGVTIGWAAAEEHRHDLKTLGIGATLLELLAAHPGLRVASISLDLRLAHERYAHRPLVQYEELASHIAAFDIGIAPLADIPFNRARSNVKLKEYAAAGVPWLASPIGPYAGLGERQGGRLVADGDWGAELERLIGNERQRRKLAKRGRKWAEGETVAKNIGRWEAALALAAARAAA